MGLQQIVLVVSIRHHVKAEQMREMPTGRSSPPPPKDNGKSQEPEFGPEGFSHHNSGNEETTAGETL